MNRYGPLDGIIRPIQALWAKFTNIFRTIDWEARRAQRSVDDVKKGVAKGKQAVGQAQGKAQGAMNGQRQAAPQSAQGASNHPLAGQVQAVRQDFAAKKMTRQQAEQRMQQLVLRDRAGSYWTVGFKSGSWYRWESDHWNRQANGPDEQ